jgi:2-oxoisovalerate dehydrogenase E1 component alpha subunit
MPPGVRPLIARATGEGPTLIEAKVTRLTGHSSDDQQTKYRSEDELEDMGDGHDPLPALPRRAARGGHSR